MSSTVAAAPSSYSDLAGVIEALPLLVREARRARGLSVRAAALQIGCSFSTISRFENGDDVNLSNAAAMLRWLDQPAARTREVCTAAADALEGAIHMVDDLASAEVLARLADQWRAEAASLTGGSAVSPASELAQSAPYGQGAES